MSDDTKPADWREEARDIAAQVVFYADHAQGVHCEIHNGAITANMVLMMARALVADSAPAPPQAGLDPLTVGSGKHVSAGSGPAADHMVLVFGRHHRECSRCTDDVLCETGAEIRLLMIEANDGMDLDGSDLSPAVLEQSWKALRQRAAADQACTAPAERDQSPCVRCAGGETEAITLPVDPETEQRTADAIANWLEAEGRRRHEPVVMAIADSIRSGKWRKGGTP